MSIIKIAGSIFANNATTVQGKVTCVRNTYTSLPFEQYISQKSDFIIGMSCYNAVSTFQYYNNIYLNHLRIHATQFIYGNIQKW